MAKPISLLRLARLLFCCIVCVPGALAQIQVNIVSRGDANAGYAIGALKLALANSDKKYTFNISEGLYTGERQKQSLIDGAVDVMWTATNRDIESAVIPIRIPLYKGLLGFRVLIVHKDNANLFSRVKDRNRLLEFKYGQGRDWSDTEIMEANGMTVVKSNKYEGLFHMADGKRFDAFPRGIHEPWGEIAARPELSLTVDKSLMLVYRMPFYLFVTPTKPELADDIERGMMRAVEDGSLDHYFYTSPVVKMVIEKVDLRSLKVFELVNPGLPSKTPVEDKRLWIDLDELKQHSLQ
ncbi:hypothetical protein [Teredinibacter haidensis]|uniref:hypothetical protein n=1 Tax=Teredinibacter haidensis TaxID=2731755 RepID=UPI0009F9A4DE|nr:hypothetical protein [Teredinibacter haidensis]